MDINNLVNPHIKNLKPYNAARNEIQNSGVVMMDANENPYSDLGQYPDPAQTELRKKISASFNVPAERIIAGNGSDEIIDLLIRIFVAPGSENIIIPEPTYGMYEVATVTQNCIVKKVQLTDNFQLDSNAILSQADTNTKMIFLCSPNNPTGNLLEASQIEFLLKNFPGIVVVDQAYVEFSDSFPWRYRLKDFPNLVVLQTFSKAWGMASVRAGLAFASKTIIEWMMRVKLPYNLNQLTQQKITEQLAKATVVNQWIDDIKSSRALLQENLRQLAGVEKIYPSEANYLLVKFKNAELVYNKLKSRGIVVRNRSNLPKCENTLRLTIGTKAENELLIAALKAIDSQKDSGLKAKQQATKF